MQNIRLEDVNVYDVLKKLGTFAGGAIVSYLFGGWSDPLALLALCCVLDWITGVSAAAYESYKNPEDPTKGINSDRGFWGIFKKFLMFSVIAVMYRFDSMLGLEGTLSLMTGATLFYLGNEVISLAENYGRLGLPMPPQIKTLIRTLKGKSEEGIPAEDKPHTQSESQNNENAN